MSTFQAGCVVGSLITFPIVERWGRRKGMILSSLVFCIGAALMVRATIIILKGKGRGNKIDILVRLLHLECCHSSMLAEQ